MGDRAERIESRPASEARLRRRALQAHDGSRLLELFFAQPLRIAGQAECVARVGLVAWPTVSCRVRVQALLHS